MAQIQKGEKIFQVADEIQVKYPELIELILQTESMDDDERQYWFDIMLSMTDPQIDRLFDILDTERKKLQDLEVKYQKEIKALNEKHLIEWQEMQVKAGKEKVAQAQAQDANTKEEDPDEILAMLNNL